MDIENDEIKFEKENLCNLFNHKLKNVGFVATRLAGTDGVSLETSKWASVFEKKGMTCFYFAGECDRAPERSYIVLEAHFKTSRYTKNPSKLFWSTKTK